VRVTCSRRTVHPSSSKTVPGTTLTRIWTDLVGRLSGPLTLRLFLQPVMASLFALRDGVRDAPAGRPPYLWTIFSEPAACS
jgi:hypothetical protein